MGKFCVNCGSEYELGENFCTKCGFSLPRAAPQFVSSTSADLVPSSKVEFVAAKDLPVVQSANYQVVHRPRQNAHSAWILGVVFICFGLFLGLIFFVISFGDLGATFGSLGGEMGRLGGEMGHVGGEMGRVGGALGGVFGELGGSFGSACGSLAYNFGWLFRLILVAMFIVPGAIFLLRSRRRSGYC
ncbi:MAG: zinc-ribbon domain-containing protein [Candidatus Hodarchaeota archaeon]